MVDDTNWVALRIEDSVLIREQTLPSFSGERSDLTKVTAAVNAPSALPIAPVRRTEAGQVHVLRIPDGEAQPGGDRLALDRLGSLPAPPEVAEAIASAVAEHDGVAAVHHLRPPWYRARWVEQALAWADEKLAGLGRRRVGPPVSLKAWSLSAVLRLPCVDTGGQARDAYLKAPCEWFGDEPAITEAIARLAPEYVPQLLAVDSGRQLLLMEPLPGADPDVSPADVAVRTAQSILDLQRRALGHLDDLQAAGCPIRDLHTTFADFERILATTPELDLLTERERAALPGLADGLRDRVERLAGCAFPTVLAHGDLHLGNVAATRDDLVIFDWSDACLTHPLFDLAHLAHTADANGGGGAEVLSQAKRTWQKVLPGAEVETGIAIAPTVNRVFQTVTAAGIAGSTEPAGAGDLGGSVAFLLRRLLAEVSEGAEVTG